MNSTYPTYTLLHSQAHSQNCEEQVLALPCLSIRMKLASHEMDFHEIWYLSIFQKSIKKIHTSVKSDMNNRNFTWRPIYIHDIYPCSS